MKIIEHKSKIILAELNPNANYIMLVNPFKVNMDTLDGLQSPTRIQIILTEDVEKSIRFVEVPKKV